MFDTLPMALDPLLPEESVPAGGTDWNRCIPLSTTDGDTERIYRAQYAWKRTQTREAGDTLIVERWLVEVTRDDVEELPQGLAGRLVNLNTPEKGKQLTAPLPDGRVGTWAEAKADLEAWCRRAGDRLRCITYAKGGGFDRLLIDLYVLPEGEQPGDSASSHMLRLGWPPYGG